jgi:hypothetical protein
MPGPVSDSYDPEFGTGANAADVTEKIRSLVTRLDDLLGPKLRNIVEVVQGPSGELYEVFLSERELRVIRFCLNRSLDCI